MYQTVKKQPFNKLLIKFPDLFEPLEPNIYKLKKGTDKVYIQTDSHDAKKTPNFLFQFRTTSDAKKNLGPWAAYEAGCKFYGVYFYHNDFLTIFNLNHLLNELELIKRAPLILEDNTTGFKIERNKLIQKIGAVCYLDGKRHQIRPDRYA